MLTRLRRRTGPYGEIARALWQNRDQPGHAWLRGSTAVEVEAL